MYYAIYDPPASASGTHWSIQDEAAREVGRFHLKADALEAAAGMSLVEALADMGFGGDKPISGVDVIDEISCQIEFYDDGGVLRGRPPKEG